jgi:hypothetical protein
MFNEITTYLSSFQEMYQVRRNFIPSVNIDIFH